MNMLLERANKWLSELGIRTEAETDGDSLKVSRDDIDSLCGIGVVYEAFLNELREALTTKKLIWTKKDNNWLWLTTL